MNNVSSELKISPEIKNILMKTANWARFLSIVGFIIVGILALSGIVVGNIFSNMPKNSMLNQDKYIISGVLGIIFYLIIAAIMFVPYFYLYRFAIKMRAAIRENNQEILLQSFENHYSYYKIIGIIAVAIVGIHIIIFFLAILGLFLRHL